MKKLLVGLVACLSVLAVAFATDVQTAFSQREIRDPRQLETILETNFTELNSRSTASTTLSGLLTLTPTAASVTNGQAVTVAASHYTLSGIGGADDSTNTITLAGASASGQVLVLTVALASTNLITIADSAPVYASGAVLMDAGDSCMFVSVGTNWVLVCESDN